MRILVLLLVLLGHWSCCQKRKETLRLIQKIDSCFIPRETNAELIENFYKLDSISLKHNKKNQALLRQFRETSLVRYLDRLSEDDFSRLLVSKSFSSSIHSQQEFKALNESDSGTVTRTDKLRRLMDTTLNIRLPNLLTTLNESIASGIFDLKKQIIQFRRYDLQRERRENLDKYYRAYLMVMNKFGKLEDTTIPSREK